MATLYEIGDHRLVCGDCRKEDDLALLFQDKKASLCITSPPYNQGLNKRLEAISKKSSGGMFKNNKKFLLKMATAYDDDLPESDYQTEQILVINNIYKYLDRDGSLFYNHKIRYRNKKAINPLEWILKTKFDLRQEIIWNKSSTIIQNAKMFMPVDERIYWLIKSGKFYFDDSKKRYSTIWPITDRAVIHDDCLPFPNKLAHRCMISCSKEGDYVFDPYGGTGTVLIVAEQLKRKTLLIEINQERCNRIKERFNGL